MKRVISVVFGFLVLSLLLVGHSNGISLEKLEKLWPKHEIHTLKSIREKFARPRLIGGLVKDDFLQAAVADDPHCPPGFQRGPRGLCREVW